MVVFVHHNQLIQLIIPQKRRTFHLFFSETIVFIILNCIFMYLQGII